MARDAAAVMRSGIEMALRLHRVGVHHKYLYGDVGRHHLLYIREQGLVDSASEYALQDVAALRSSDYMLWSLVHEIFILWATLTLKVLS